MQIGVVQFPGSNCERETKLAIKRAGMVPVEFLWNEPAEKLRDFDGYIIVGGFSYEDRSRAGIIAALDPVMQELRAQSELGKPILGICNGAQILVETGLVPGIENHKVGMALTENKRMADGKILGTGYYNDWVHMRLSTHYQRNAFTKRLLPSDVLRVPVAHGEGRFVMSPALLQEVQIQGLNVFQYCDEKGVVEDRFPTNPNGSLDNIAGVANKAGNVLALMPHPERTTIGDPIFQSMHDYILERGAEGYQVQKIAPLSYYPRPEKIKPYPKKSDTFTCVIELLITDNQALTVENTLKQLGFAVNVKRQVHWEVACESEAIYKQIIQSGVLFNDRKECITEPLTSNHDRASYLVLAKEDWHGLEKQQLLQDTFGVNGITSIRYGVLWHFSVEDSKMAAQIESLLSTNIVSNPYAHDCYQY